MKEKQRWLIFEDNGWQIIIPDFDIKPHGFPNGTDDVEVENLNCPCGLRIDWLNRAIIHNSFEEKEKVEQAMLRISESD